MITLDEAMLDRLASKAAKAYSDAIGLTDEWRAAALAVLQGLLDEWGKESTVTKEVPEPHPLEYQEGMTFSAALYYLKEGERVTHPGMGANWLQIRRPGNEHIEHIDVCCYADPDPYASRWRPSQEEFFRKDWRLVAHIDDVGGY